MARTPFPLSGNRECSLSPGYYSGAPSPNGATHSQTLPQLILEKNAKG